MNRLTTLCTKYDVKLWLSPDIKSTPYHLQDIKDYINKPTHMHFAAATKPSIDPYKPLGIHVLSSIPGIGEAVATKIRNVYPTIGDLASIPKDELKNKLIEIPNIGNQISEAVYGALWI